jgi:hypothetical protein
LIRLKKIQSFNFNSRAKTQWNILEDMMILIFLKVKENSMAAMDAN